MSGESVIPSVLSRCSKDLKWQTSVIALLQLSFIQQAKDSTPLRHEGGLTQKERPQSVLASSFYSFVSSLLSLPYANWASQEGSVYQNPSKIFVDIDKFILNNTWKSTGARRANQIIFKKKKTVREQHPLEYL